MTIGIEVRNPSSTEERDSPVKYYLPPEVSVADVRNSAGFDVKYDLNRSQVYLENRVKLAPSSTKSMIQNQI